EYINMSATSGTMKLRREERQKDHISHFILRLAYCRTEELREWFLRHETALFRHRLTTADVAERQKFLASLELGHKQLSAKQKEAMRAQLTVSCAHIPNFNFDKETFLEVNFEDALDLVQQRRVYLRDGFAYVPAQEQVALVISEFRRQLAASLEVCAKAVPQMEEDERLLPVLKNISQQNTGKEYTGEATAGKVMADDVEGLSPLFPLCMQHLYRSLRAESHMKHGGRMQFGLFLKGIGMPVEEGLIFWRRSFSKITDDQFQKSYAYNIRHNYGLEGKRADYTPYSCTRIITSNGPSTGDHHGCPFRHFSADNLRRELQAVGANEGDVREILELVAGGHYQIACTKLFEQTQLARARQKGTAVSGVTVDTITHPNHYFEQAYKLAHGD
ncbi:eukaryotic and archaeal DNA primase, large subunit-domain-containing protein, partial [Thamnocephalis sphaerospora]